MHVRRLELFPERYPTADRYPFDQPVLRQTRELSLAAPVTFFTGENGTGKSTLLEAIGRRCGIHLWRNSNDQPLEANPYAEALHHFLHVEWAGGRVPGSYFSSQDFRHYTYTIDQWATTDRDVLRYFGGRSLVTQSHGQSLMAYFRSRYRIRGLYFLDEPETALSPATQIELLHLLRDMGEAGHAQFVVATHSPILLACPGATIYSFDHHPVRAITYEESPLYRIYRSFMEDPAGHL